MKNVSITGLNSPALHRTMAEGVTLGRWVKGILEAANALSTEASEHVPLSTGSAALSSEEW